MKESIEFKGVQRENAKVQRIFINVNGEREKESESLKFKIDKACASENI